MATLEQAPQLESQPVHLAYLPIDKTYVRVLLALDYKHGFSDSRQILAQHTDIGALPDDTRTFLQALEDYALDRPVRVGEGGANYRTMLYLSQLDGITPDFVKEGSLKERSIYEGDDLTTRSNEDLLELDAGTTQYLIARLIWDDLIMVPPHLIAREYKLQVAQAAQHHWYNQREQEKAWAPPVDATIQRQAELYLRATTLGFKDATFYMEQAEDYCFARAFGYVEPEEAEELWPKLRYHESYRIATMEEAIDQATSGRIITANDHRVVQAIAMRFGLGEARFAQPACVTKSWPRFWEFIQMVRS